MDSEANKRLGELIVKLAQGNKSEKEEAINEIYRLISKILYTVGNTFYRTREDIEDSVQNLLLALFLKAGTYKQNKNACGWIMKIYRNTFNNYYKRCKTERENFKTQVLLLRERHSSFEDYSDKYILLNYIIGELHGIELKLFYLRFLYGCSLNDIAIELKKPKSTIEYRIEKLKTKINNL